MGIKPVTFQIRVGMLCNSELYCCLRCCLSHLACNYCLYFGWNHLQCTVVALAHGSFLLFFSQKTIENLHVPKQQLYAHAVNEFTLYKSQKLTILCQRTQPIYCRLILRKYTCNHKTQANHWSKTSLTLFCHYLLHRNITGMCEWSYKLILKINTHG